MSKQSKHELNENFLDHKRVRRLILETPSNLRAEDEYHILIFRRVLEVAMSQGRWNGFFPDLS